MYLQTSAIQDLCYNYTWPLLFMLLGAWLLGLLFWHGWWIRNKRRYAGEMQQLKTSNDQYTLQLHRISASHAQLHDEIQQKNDDLVLVQTEYENLKLQTKSIIEENERLKAQLFLVEEDENEDLGFAEEGEDEESDLVDEGSQETDNIRDSLGANAPGAIEQGGDSRGPEGIPDEGADQRLKRRGTFDFSAIPEEDLKIIEGIGPKIEQLLKAQGIKNWKSLSKTTLGQLSDMLQEAGARYRFHDPSSWTQQARLATEKRWEELVVYQNELRGIQDGSYTTKIERALVKLTGIAYEPQNLKVIEGIGPKIEKLIKSAGIADWSELANTSVETLQDILNSAGAQYRMHNPTSWPEQARLAALGNWEELRKFQKRLD